MIVLLPCYSLEDFSLYRKANEADEIFSAWTALYHPALLRISGRLPGWEPIASPMVGRKYKLVVIPPHCQAEVPTDLLHQWEEEGVLLVRNCSTRESIVAEALRLCKEKIEALNVSQHEDREKFPTEMPAPFQQDIVDSFYSLGLAYFVSDLLTRKLRYMSDIDSPELEKRLFLALDQFQTNTELPTTTETGSSDGTDALQKAFDQICEATEYYFPTPAKFIDLTWFDEEEDAGIALEKMLLLRRERNEKTNLFVDSRTLDRLEKIYPDSLRFLREETAAGRVEIIAGDRNESPLYLLPQMQVLRELRAGLERSAQLTGGVPTVFGRYEAGYSPVLPQLLHLCGCRSALLFSKDGWTTDYKSQNRVNWKGIEGTVVTSCAKKPLDGEKGSEFMELLDHLGYSWHNDDVMTAIYAHRPGKEAPWWGDVARFNRFAPIFGEVIGLKEYFELTKTIGSFKMLGRDDFRTNFLTRASKSDSIDPVSTWASHYREYGNELVQAFDSTVRPLTVPPEMPPKKEKGKEQKQEKGKNKKSVREDKKGFLVYNPSLSERLVILPGKAILQPETAQAVLLTEPNEQGTFETLVRIPATTQLWLETDPSASELRATSPTGSSSKGHLKHWIRRLFKTKVKETKQVANLVEYVHRDYSRTESETYYSMQNEFFELRIDPVTGAIKRLGTFESGELKMTRGLLSRPGRGNRFSAQVILRLSEEQKRQDHRDRQSVGYGYSIMAADEFNILSPGPLTGRLQIKGHLVTPSGETVAQFEQILTIQRASRVVDVELQFKPLLLPTGHSWDNYYGCRFAWGDQFAEIRAGVGERLWKTNRDYFQAPECLDIRSEEKLGMTILSGGLSFYRQHEVGRLDSILIPKNESSHSFHFGIGVDLVDPVETALEFLSPSPRVTPNALRPNDDVLRFLEISTKEGAVLPVGFDPVYNNKSRLIGLVITLLETGKGTAKVNIRFPRKVREVSIADLTVGTAEGSVIALPVPSSSGEPISQSSNESSKNEKEKPAVYLKDKKTIALELKRNQLLPLRIIFEADGK